MRRQKTKRSAGEVTYAPDRQATRRGVGPYRRILVPLDGTPTAETALRPAAELAARTGGVLNLVGVVTDTLGTLPPLDPLPISGVADTVDRNHLRGELLHEVCVRVREEWGCQTTYELLTDGSVTDALVDAATRLEADLVVAATHLRGWLTRTILGSTTEDLVRAGPFPVLVVPADGSEPDATTPMQEGISSIVIAVDPDATLDDRAIAHGVLWAQLWNAQLVLARAVVALPPPAAGMELSGPIAMPSIVPELRDAAERELGAIGEALRREGVDADTRILEGEAAADALLRHVESTEADLLVVGRHPKSFWGRLFEGSESSRLVRGIRTAGLLVCHEEVR